MRQSTRQKKRNKRARNRGVLAISFAVLALAGVLTIHTNQLKTEDTVYEKKEAALRAESEAESQRAESLEDRSIYVQTKQYIEQIARERLGLVNPDEAIIKPSE